MQTSRVPAIRVLAGVAGAAAVVYALRRRKRHGRRAMEIRESVTVDAPPGRVYTFLTEWEQWPQWMSHVREVTPRGRVGGRERTHWVVDGPLGVPVSWDAITTSLVPNEEIAWETVPGTGVEHAGVIRLAATDAGSTRIEVLMSYHPPAGVVGHAVAASVGRDPRRQMDGDLARLKTTIETGRPLRDAAARD